MSDFYEAIQKRRTNYTLGKNIKVPATQIIQTIQNTVHEVPSAFNMQSGKVIVTFGKKHEAIWRITKNILKARIPADAFVTTEAKINSFAAAYGTILYFDDTEIVQQMQKEYSSYADNFPIWAQQANGMMQFAIWTALSDLGLGVNMQHYNPLIDEEIKKLFEVPTTWKLIAQMPFGEALQQPDPIQKHPIETRVIISK